MKVILLKDVAGVGRRDDVKEVSDGFARNQLIPRGDAEIATPKTLAALIARKERLVDTKLLEHSLLDKNIASVQGKAVVFVRNANEKGYLYAKIKPHDIAGAISEQFHVEIPPSVIVLSKYIETIGAHRALLKSDGVTAEIILDVHTQ